MRLLLIPLALVCLQPAATADAKQLITAADLLRIQRVTEIQVAPSGAFAIYGVQSIHTAKGKDGRPAYSYRTNLWYIDLQNKQAQPRQLTYGDRSDSGLALSPDATQLAFVRTATTEDGKKTPQVWLLPLGSGGGEAQQVTHLETGAVAPVWHPDSKSLLVTSAVPLSKLGHKPDFDYERPNRDWHDTDIGTKKDKIDARPDGDRQSIRNWLEQNASRDNPFVITRLAFQAETSLQKEMTVPVLYHSKLTGDPVKLAEAVAGCSWAPDAKTIACSGTPQGTTHPDRVRRSAVYLIDPNGNKRVLLDNPDYNYRNPHFSQDSRTLYVLVQQTDEQMFRQTTLATVPLQGKPAPTPATDWPSSIQDFTIANDGALLFTSAWHGGFPLHRVTPADKRRNPIIEGPVGVQTFDEGGGRIVYALTQIENPNELYLRDKDGTTRRLTKLNTEWLADRELATVTEKWITRPDGFKIQTWTMNPTRTEPNRRYPWVLDIHGGPTAMWGPGEFSMWHEFQLLCAWGYGVVYSNPRGSGGYGYDFQKGNFQNWGDKPAGDVLAAVDEAVRTNPLIDKDRLFITGGSYAGYLTAWIIAHDHRFKAAVAQRGVYDLTTFYGEGNAFFLVKNAFGGRPYEDKIRPLLDQQSPFTYAAQIRTPFLIIHGSNDLRTGVTQSEMLYRALKDMGKPVEYIRYPGASHELTRSGDPMQRMDHALRIVEFFERYANNTTPAPASSAAQ